MTVTITHFNAPARPIIADAIPDDQTHCRCGTRLNNPDCLFDLRVLDKSENLDLDIQELRSSHGGRHVWFCQFCKGVTIRQQSNGPTCYYEAR